MELDNRLGLAKAFEEPLVLAAEAFEFLGGGIVGLRLTSPTFRLQGVERSGIATSVTRCG